MMWTRRINRLSQAFAELSGWLIVPMMLTIFIDAVLRGLFNQAVAGVVEFNSLLLVAMVYLGLAGAQAKGANFRVTLLSDRLPPWLNKVLITIGYLLMLLTLSTLLWFCSGAALFSFERDEVSYGLIDFPLWPSRALICLGLTLLMVQYLADGVLFLLRGQDPFAEQSLSTDLPRTET